MMEIQSIIALNFGISALLALISFQAVNSFKKREFVALTIAWAINAALMVEKVSLDAETNSFWMKFWLIEPNLLSSYYLAVPYFIRNRRLLGFHVIGMVLAIALGLTLSLIGTKIEELVLTVISLVSILYLFSFFRRLRDDYERGSKSCKGLFISQIGIGTYLLAHLIPIVSYLIYETFSDLDWAGHSVAILGKVTLIIGLFTYVKGLIEEKVKAGTLAEELNKILGLTFHELRYMINAYERRLNRLQKEKDNYRYNDATERVLNKIEFETNRLKAIYDASTQRYLSNNFSDIRFDKRIPDKELTKFGFKDEVFSINKIIELAHAVFKTSGRAVEATEFFYNENAKFIFEYGKNCLTKGNQLRLTQVFVNLFQNAFEAFPHGEGEIFVKTSIILKEIDSQRVKFVSVIVEDSGRGIKGTNLKRIFEENFSTKRAKTLIKGFGLAESREIVINELGGSIKVESPVAEPRIKSNRIDENRGTKFELIFRWHGREKKD